MFAKKLIALLIAGSFVSASVYAANNNETKAQTKQDKEIIGWLIVLNKNEIAAAREVQKKKVSPEVKAYANWMIAEHSKNLQETLSLSRKLGEAPINTKLTNHLKQQGKTQLGKLKPLKGDKLQNAYINDMVKDHSEALDTIDNKLLSSTNHPALKTHLQATRTHVEQHLDKAETIQDDLDGR